MYIASRGECVAKSWMSSLTHSLARFTSLAMICSANSLQLMRTTHSCFTVTQSPEPALCGVSDFPAAQVRHVVSAADFAQTAAVLGAMTCLTSLEYYQSVPGQPTVPSWCQSLLGLTMLKALRLVIRDDLQCSDLQSLVALTGLRRLYIDNGGLSDLGAVALADSLTGLTSLGLHSKGMKTTAVLHPVSKLTGLRILTFVPDSPVAASQLRHLAPLTQLKHLFVKLADDCMKEIENQFLQRMPHLTRIGGLFPLW